MNYNETRVLIVDDVVENLQLATATLKPLGCKLSHAKNGQQCLELVKEKEPDLILLDIMMPVMDGFETCQILKENPKTQKIPVILLSAFDANEDIVRGFELGAVDFIPKPFKSNELTARVKVHLENKLLKDKLIKDNKLKEEMLLQESKMAVMGEMIDMVAHQWKNPIGAIDMCRMSIEMTLHDILQIKNDAIDKDLSTIQTLVTHTNDTLDEFRSFFRPDKHLESISIKKLIDSVGILMKDQLISNQITLNINGDENIKIYVSANEIKHILINLFNNSKDAFKYKEEKIRNRDITCDISENETQIILQISDNAGGIPLDIIHEIFQANFTTKKEYGGTGIGLYMCQLIANKYDGKIDVRNSDLGAVFTISFNKNSKE